ncbi:Uncharacterised protein [Yersinia intermedia]|nr:Uncharacterised protein [Yersinia intermedia]
MILSIKQYPLTDQCFPARMGIQCQSFSDIHRSPDLSVYTSGSLVIYLRNPRLKDAGYTKKNAKLKTTKPRLKIFYTGYIPVEHRRAPVVTVVVVDRTCSQVYAGYTIRRPILI